MFFGVIALYWPVSGYPFVRLDDPEYVSENVNVLSGLSWSGLSWAFTSFDAANWHPLTWLSHMLDCQLFGLNAGRHHLHSVLLHALNSSLLFMVLRRLTSAIWRSALVAAIFAVHPLHVESVAWISERKDVLSTLLFLLTLWAYARFAEVKSAVSADRRPQAHNTAHSWIQNARVSPPAVLPHFGRSAYYVLALVFFALGLMSKPMLVTLPFVLLLLDFWPLKRWQIEYQANSVHSAHSKTKPTPLDQSRASNLDSPGHSGVPLPRLLAEKLPFLAMSIASCIVTCLAQKHAMRSLVDLPLSERLVNATVSFSLYVTKFLWPAGLAVFYAWRQWPLSQFLPAIAFLMLVTGWALWRAREYPWLLAGWAWYLGTLVPVLGLVQVGSQSMADRYAYIPSIGLSIVLAFSLSAAALRKALVSSLCLAALVTLAFCCCLQLRHWRCNLDLYLHALSVELPNSASTFEVGYELVNAGNCGQGLLYLEWAYQMAPEDPQIHAAIGRCLAEGGMVNQGITRFRALLQRAPDSQSLRVNLAILLTKAGKHDEAVALFSEALRAQPDATTHYNLALALTKQGQFREAEFHYVKALQLKPNLAPACERLATLLFGQYRFAEAADRFRQFLELRPDHAEAHSVLGLCLVSQNKPHNAIRCFREAIRLDPKLPVPRNELAWILATDPDVEVRNGPEALQLALRACDLTTNREPSFLGTLDAAYAEVGRFKDAMETASKARDLFLAGGETNLALMAERRLELYGTAKPYHQESTRQPDAGRRARP